MSVIRCDLCDRYIDTDYDCEGLWGVNGDTPNGEDFICGSCAEREQWFEEEVAMEAAERWKRLTRDGIGN